MGDIQKTYEWAGPKYIKPHRGILWYAAVSLIAVGTIVYAFKTRDLFFSFAVLLTLGILIIHDLGHDELVPHELSYDGLKTGDAEFPYDKLVSFRVIKGEPESVLIKTKLGIRPFLELNIQGADRERIVSLLERRVKRDDSLELDRAGKLIRLLKL